MLPKNVIYYGTQEALPKRLELKAGTVSLVYEAGDLRYIRWEDQEVIRRVYVAVRDRNWGTIPPRFTDIQVQTAPDSFRISYQVENQQNDIDFTWKAEITGSVDGTIRFSMNGQAQTTFLRNRIGFCILHPAACAGGTCWVEHMDGEQEVTVFPEDICADQPVRPFANMRSITHQVQPGLLAKVEFCGDIFEMEDQRNWTDASFKTYCTPLSLPYPVEIQAGTQISQIFTLSFEDQRNRQFHAGIHPISHPVPLELDLIPTSYPLPQMGLGVASHGQPLSELEMGRLKALNLNHLRVDLQLSEPDYAAKLALAADQARQLGIYLDIALFTSTERDADLTLLKQVVQEIQPPVATWLVYPHKEQFKGGSQTQEAVQMARKALKIDFPDTRFAAGTNTDFIFLKRTLPPTTLLDAICLSINPQVHAFDNTSLVETLEAQAMVVKSAKRLANGLPVIISPVTLKPRHNPYATGPASLLPAGELPPQVDIRQMSLFCAGWTAGSINSLSESGAYSLTYYETTGWRGVMDIAAGSPLPQQFHSLPESVFPVYHILADAGEFLGGETAGLKTSDPLKICGMVLKKGSRRRVILSSFSNEPLNVSLQMAGEVKIRYLDEFHYDQAVREPEVYRAGPGEAITDNHGKIKLALSPYATARIDFSE